ncbi:MAG: PrsW family intramembrane metalloprotease [Deltaproteobacteria bacterium]|nr:PrsW family intramembrane metalloprotease [Deltaproteobacteria bacterium]
MYLLLALSQLPIVLLFSYVYARDNDGREPLRILFYSFLCGMLVLPIAAAVEFVLEVFVLPHEIYAPLYHGLQMFFGVALVEESCKLAALLLIAYRKPDFNEPFDGIIYAVAVSLGFAALENALYCLQFGIGAAWLRMFSAVPMHAMSAVLLGFYVGRAKFEHDPKQAKLLILAGLLASSVAHGSYNYFVAVEEGVYFPAAILILLVQIFLARRAMRIYNSQRGITVGSACMYLPEQDRSLLGTPLGWAVFALLVVGALGMAWSLAASAGWVDGDILQLNHEEMIHAGWLGVALSTVLLAGVRGLKRHRSWAWRFALFVFVTIVPSPLFILSIAGLFGLLHPQSRSQFAVKPQAIVSGKAV